MSRKRAAVFEVGDPPKKKSPKEEVSELIKKIESNPRGLFVPSVFEQLMAQVREDAQEALRRTNQIPYNITFCLDKNFKMNMWYVVALQKFPEAVKNLAYFAKMESSDKTIKVAHMDMVSHIADRHCSFGLEAFDQCYSSSIQSKLERGIQTSKNQNL